VGCAVFASLVIYMMWIYGRRRFWRYFQTEEGRANTIYFLARLGYPPAVEDARRMRERARELLRETKDKKQRQTETLFAEYAKLPHFEFKDHETQPGFKVRSERAAPARQAPEVPPKVEAAPPADDRVGQVLAAAASELEQQHDSCCAICMNK